MPVIIQKILSSPKARSLAAVSALIIATFNAGTPWRD